MLFQVDFKTPKTFLGTSYSPQPSTSTLWHRGIVFVCVRALACVPVCMFVHARVVLK
jgi:hypothetical protein